MRFCSFIDEDILDEEIHIGKEHESNVQFGVCEVALKDHEVCVVVVGGGWVVLKVNLVISFDFGQAEQL